MYRYLDTLVLSLVVMIIGLFSKSYLHFKESSLLYAFYPPPAKIDLLRISFSYTLDYSTSLKTASTCWTATLQIISMSLESWFIVRTT